jgi:hypothetical protein
MPLYLVHVAQAHNVPRSLDLIPDTAVPMKLITSQTRSVPGRIGGFLSSPVNTAMSANSPPTTSRKRTFQLQSVPQRTRVLPVVALQLSSLLTKSYGSATNSIARSLIQTKSVPTETVFAMTHGTPTDPLGSISTAHSYRCVRPDRASFSNRTFRRTAGRWRPYRSLKLRLQFGTQRICTCPDRSPL